MIELAPSASMSAAEFPSSPEWQRVIDVDALRAASRPGPCAPVTRPSRPQPPARRPARATGTARSRHQRPPRPRAPVPAPPFPGHHASAPHPAPRWSRRHSSVPSVGPVTAAAFLAAIDDAQRFRHAHQLEAYLGLVPGEYSSGETQRRGAITKAGHSRPRWLLIQAAVSILRRRPPQADELRTWALRIAARRGKQVAVVALARRLAGILYALLRDGSVFERQHIRPPRPAAAALVNV